MAPDSKRRPLFERILTASPMGIAIVIVGIVLAIVFYVRIDHIAGRIHDADLRQVVEALRLTLPVLWLGFALWGFQLIDAALDRKDFKERVQVHQRTLERIDAALATEEFKTRKQADNSKSFWNRFRSDAV